jgi:hypothetical protein
MKRRSDWQFRLAEHHRQTFNRSFEWGEFDCAMAVCDAVKAMTGEDPAPGYRGTYHSLAAALKICGGDLGNFAGGIAKAHGFREVPPAFGRRGDVVLVDNGEPSHALGIVDLSGRFALCACEKGTVRLPMTRWLRAWQVG